MTNILVHVMLAAIWSPYHPRNVCCVIRYTCTIHYSLQDTIANNIREAR